MHKTSQKHVPRLARLHSIGPEHDRKRLTTCQRPTKHILPHILRPFFPPSFHILRPSVGQIIRLINRPRGSAQLQPTSKRLWMALGNGVKLHPLVCSPAQIVCWVWCPSLQTRTAALLPADTQSIGYERELITASSWSGDARDIHESIPGRVAGSRRRRVSLQRQREGELIPKTSQQPSLTA